MKNRYSLPLFFIITITCLPSLASPFLPKKQEQQSIAIQTSSEYNFLATKKEQGRWLAFVNNKWLKKGQSINELTISDIQAFKIILSDGQVIFLGNKSIETATTGVKNGK